MNSLKISPLALEDMAEIRRYISNELHNPTAAEKVLRNITKNMRGLLQYPEVGAPLEATINIETNYRYLICGHYAVFYRYEAPSIFVDRVLYGKRDFMAILFGKPMI